MGVRARQCGCEVMATLTTAQKVEADAREAAARHLCEAAQFAALHFTAKPLFQKLMRRPNGPPVMVRLDYPGVLRGFDPKTGQQLFQSTPGRPAVLSRKKTRRKPSERVKAGK